MSSTELTPLRGPCGPLRCDIQPVPHPRLHASSPASAPVSSLAPVQTPGSQCRAAATAVGAEQTSVVSRADGQRWQPCALGHLQRSRLRHGLGHPRVGRSGCGRLHAIQHHRALPCGCMPLLLCPAGARGALGRGGRLRGPKPGMLAMWQRGRCTKPGKRLANDSVTSPWRHLPQGRVGSSNQSAKSPHTAVRCLLVNHLLSRGVVPAMTACLICARCMRRARRQQMS